MHRLGTPSPIHAFFLAAGLAAGCDSPSAGTAGGTEGGSGNVATSEAPPDETSAADDADDDGDDGGTPTDGGPADTGGGDTGPGSTDTMGGGPDADDGNDDGTPSPGCGGPSPGPGVHTTLPLAVDGVPRTYDLFVPTTYDESEPAPLVLNFHGLLGSPTNQSTLSQFNLAAEPRGMVVAYPAGIGQSFNGGTCCGDASAQGVDDVGFARALVDHISTTMCIDSDRVFVTGMSNGGHMAHLLACEAADVFAAAASVTGVLTIPPFSCTPSRPISVMDFHGDEDPIVPFGGTGIGFPDVRTMMADWAARNGCQGTSQTTFDQGDMQCETWPQCGDDVEVTLCVTDGGGHCWPGAASCLFGDVSSAMSASETIATMFMDHPM